jgi:GST-like protein
MSAASDMSGMVTTIFTIGRAKEPHGPTLDTFKSMWKNYLRVWDYKLGKQHYCVGDELTVADFALYGVYARAKGNRPELCEGFPNVARWAEELAARPAIQRAMKF